MKISEVTTLARNLMDSHGLEGIPLKIGTAKTQLGSCGYTRDRLTGKAIPKYIKLSAKWMTDLPREEVVDTILHEIAHALTPGAKHGPAWKAMCRKIGAKPQRLASNTGEIREIHKSIAKYKVVCPGPCDRTLGHINRLGKNYRMGRYICPKCRTTLKVVPNV